MLYSDITGVTGYLGFGRSSVTALIPAFLGLVLLAVGILALNEKYHRHAINAASALGLLGFLGTVSGLSKLFTLVGGGELARSAAVVSQSVMTLLSLTFFLFCLKSFIDAPRKVNTIKVN